MMKKNSSTWMNVLQGVSGGWWVLAIFIYITVVTALTPVMVDDFNVHGDGQTLFAFHDAWQYYKGMYVGWSGRLAHILFGFLSLSFYREPFHEWPSQIILATLNGLVFVIFLLSLFFLAFGRAPRFVDNSDRIRILLLFFLTMTCLARIGETIFWLNGRCVYLWTATALCCFLVFYRLQIKNNKFLSFATVTTSYRQFFFLLLFLTLAMVAGMASEIGGLTVIVLLASLTAYKLFYKKISLPLWHWLGLLFFIIGYILLMTAPGNLIRANHPVFDEFHKATLLQHLFSLPSHSLPRQLGFFIGKTKGLFLLLLLGLVLWLKTENKNFNNILHNNFAWAVIFFITSMIFLVIQTFNPAPSGRTFFIGTIFFVVSFILLLDHIFLSLPQSKTPRIFAWLRLQRKYFFVGTIVLVTAYLVYIMVITIKLHHQFTLRTAFIAAQKESGLSEIILQPYRMNTRFFIQMSNSQWEMMPMADYYGVKKISIAE